MNTADGESESGKVSRTIAVLRNRELPWVNPRLVLLLWSNHHCSTGDRNEFN